MSNVDEKEQGLDPGGGIWDRLDVSRREVVQQLCGEKGMTLFSFLLESSTINDNQENEVVFSLQRLCDIAAQLGWSPDTVKRYVAVFRAVNLVHHYHDCRREVKLHLPLGPYVPLTNFSALDELIGKRKKQRQLALKVKLRYIVRFGDPTQTHSYEMRQTLQEVKAILDDEHLEPLKRERLQMKIADVLTRLTSSEIGHAQGDLNTLLGDRQAASSSQKLSTSSTEGDSNKGMEVSRLAQQKIQGKEPDHEGDLDQQEGDSRAHYNMLFEQAKGMEGDSKYHEGDLIPTAPSPTSLPVKQGGDLNTQQGDSITDTHIDKVPCLQAAQHTQGDLNTQQGDSVVQECVQQAQKEGQMGDSNQHMMLKEGDSKNSELQEVLLDEFLTYNVNYLINNISINVKRKRMAQFLGKTLEHDTNVFKKYLKLFNDFAPEVVGRAFLSTMVLMHRDHWSIDRPGAFFTSQCRALSGQAQLKGYTLDDVEEWLRNWGTLPYSKLLIVLAAPSPMHVSSAPAPLITTQSRTLASSPVGVPFVNGSSRHTSISTNKKKRTYGVQFTGRPITLNKGTHNLSSPKPLSGKS